MTKILGFAGKKQSGKNTSANMVAATILHQVGYQTSIDNKTGNLLLLSEDNQLVNLDLTTRHKELRDWMEENIFPFVKIYSFADQLKSFCINTLGLTVEQCYGTDEQKNSKTTHKWNVFRKFASKKTYEKINKENCWNKYMTAREILQVFGTDVMRTIYRDCWVDSTLHTIDEEKVAYAIISDIRFPNEVVGTQKANGKVILHTRCPFKDKDLHESEHALDDFSAIDAILDNQNMSIEQQGVRLSQILQEIKW